jgi:transcriptional regulator GlxA family with amidase domain
MGGCPHPIYANPWCHQAEFRPLGRQPETRKYSINPEMEFSADREESRMDPRVERVIALMKGDLRQGLSLGEMAHLVNLSPAHLCNLFKAETGTSPARYLRSLRMIRAQTLLINTFLSVKEIMVGVGLSDQSHFVRDFKRINGTTPTQYRRRNRVTGVNEIVETADNQLIGQ